MARNIALTLTLNGVEQTVNSIEELKIAINNAEGSLRSFTGNDKEFKKLQNQIEGARKSLSALTNEKGLKDSQKTFSSFVQLGSTVTASFATAQAALSLFGGESTNVAKAATVAQNTLTIALGARELAEAKTTLSTVALTIATKAQTAADNAQIGVLKRLYTLIASNPYTALAVAIGLVVTAIIALVNSETEQEKQAKKAAEANKQFLESLKTAGLQSKITANQVGQLTALYEDGALKLETYRASIEKLVPGLRNVDITTENGRKTLNNYVTQLANLGRVQDEIAAKTTEYSDALKNGNAERARVLRVQLNFLAVEQANYLEAVKQIEDQDKQIEKDREAREQARKKRIEDRIKALDEELELLKKRIQLERENIDVLTEASKFTPAEALVVQRLEERYKNQQAVNESLKQYLPLQQQLELGLTKINEISQDKGFELFDKFLTNVNEGFVMLGESVQPTTSDLQKFYNEVNALGKLFQLGGGLENVVNEEAVKNLEGAIQNVKILAQTIIDFKNAGITDFPTFDTFRVDVLNIKKELDDALINPDRERVLRGRLNTIEKQFQDAFLKLKMSTQEYRDAEKKINQESGLDDTERQNRLKALQEEYRTTGKVLFENLSEGVVNFDLFSKGISDVRAQVILLQMDIKKLLPAELADFLIKNKDLLTQAFTVNLGEVKDNRQRLLDLEKEIQNKTFDQRKIFSSEVEQLEYTFAQNGIDISKLTYEQKLVLLQGFLEKEVKQTEDAEKTKQDNLDKTTQKILKNIQLFQTALNAIQQTVTDYYDFQFDQLEKRNKRIQETITGDSKRANELRLENEKIYTAERRKLEKEQAKISLGIALAQSIANTAQAITQALTAGPIAGPILASIVGIAGAAQTVIIGAQIAQIDKYRKGGRLKMAGGGYVTGPSHEFGGVKYQAGGVELEGSESVINRVSTIQYSDLLSQINQAGGGRPIVMNNFDDSRIVEAIARQRREPIKAYVVESEITGKQSVARRLESLSQL